MDGTCTPSARLSHRSSAASSEQKVRPDLRAGKVREKGFILGLRHDRKGDGRRGVARLTAWPGREAWSTQT